MDKKKIIIISAYSLLGLALLALLVLWIAVKIKEKSVYDGGDPNKKKGESSKGESSIGMKVRKWNTTPLKWGSGTSLNYDIAATQNYVRQIQQICNSWLRSGLIKDGVWGDKTERAVQRLKTMKARPVGNVGGVYGGYNLSAYTICPFASYLTQVKDPVSSISKVQINAENYLSMIKWHNSHISNYARVV